MQRQPAKSQLDTPPVVVWELTRACRVQCMHCTAGAQARRSPLELSTYEAYKTIDQIVSLRPREVIITGGDPFERADLFQLADYARRRGIRPAVTLSGSQTLTGSALGKLHANGADRVIAPIDGHNPERHDAVRGVNGHFGLTLQAIRWARTAGLEVEVDTLVCRQNALDLSTIADLIAGLGVVRWNLYFPVPVKQARRIDALNADEAEKVFATIFELSSRLRFPIRTFEAPQYGRFVLQSTLKERQQLLEREVSGGGADTDIAPSEVLFISHTGEVSFSAFVPAAAGNVRYQPLSSVYRSSDLPAALRDPSNLKGKCGRCEYRTICRGSRARAYAVTGDLFASDPLCAYQPGAFAQGAALVATAAPMPEV